MTETFASVYREELERAVARRPQDYSWPVGRTVRDVAGKMVVAFREGTASKTSFACKHTCRRLGIPHTYEAIKARIAQDDKQESAT